MVSELVLSATMQIKLVLDLSCFHEISFENLQWFVALKKEILLYVFHGVLPMFLFVGCVLIGLYSTSKYVRAL